MQPFAEEISFKLHLTDQDIGQLLGRYTLALDTMEEDDSPGPASRRVHEVTEEAYARLRKQLETAVGAKAVKKALAVAEALDVEATAKIGDKRHEIAFRLPARDVGILMTKVDGGLDDAAMHLEDEEGRLAGTAILNMCRVVRRGLEREIGAAIVADLMEQAETLWAGSTDEIVEDIKRMADRKGR